MSRLTDVDRDFFAALADVVFGNPFTPQRDQLIVRLAPGAPLGDLTSDREALARVVAPRLQSVLREGAQAVERLGDDPGVGQYRHKVGVPVPPRHDVPVQVTRQARSRDAPEGYARAGNFGT